MRMIASCEEIPKEKNTSVSVQSSVCNSPSGTRALLKIGIDNPNDQPAV